MRRRSAIGMVGLVAGLGSAARAQTGDAEPQPSAPAAAQVPPAAAAPASEPAPEATAGATSQATPAAPTAVTPTTPAPASEPAPEATAPTASPSAAAPDAAASETALPAAPATAPDTLGGAFRLAVGWLGVLPFGELQHDVSAYDALGLGQGVEAELGLGLSRTVVAGVWGNAVFHEENGARDARPRTFALGAFVAYHLVQGTRLDPWMSYGLGYIAAGGEHMEAYRGIDVARIRVGGDWFATPWLAVGPVLGIDLNLYLGAEGETLAGEALHFDASAGLRLTLQLPER